MSVQNRPALAITAEPTSGSSTESVPSYVTGFTTLDKEVRIAALPTRGQVPPWLTGTLIRNGPARFEVGQQNLRHWFDGLAMLHSFSFRDGAVAYANKFLRSNVYRAAEKTGKLTYGGFATDPCRSIFQRAMSLFERKIGDNANVNLTRIAGRFVAMTETPLPIEFDLATLETVGVFTYGADDRADHLRVQHTTAHPHHDPATRQLFNYFVSFGRTSSYNVYSIQDGRRERQVFGTTAVREPSYIHSFALTENYVVVAEYPYVVNPLKLLVGGPFIENFVWKPERGTRFFIFRRNGNGLAAICPAEPFFCFHYVNAFEEGDVVQVDLVAYDDSRIIHSLYLDALRGESSYSVPPGRLRRYRLPLDGGEATSRLVSHEPMELPRIDYRRNGRGYRYVYACATTPDDFMSGLLQVDVRSGHRVRWSEPGCYPGEPMFVARPSGETENDGVVLSVVLDGRHARSFLLILDAATFQEIARAEVPHHIPFGFHGQYVGQPGSGILSPET
jgi:carotenoid cleavage dioxygenase-like enzyme